jgi:hypothetical protein
MEIVDKVAAAGVKGGETDGPPVQQLVMSKINSFEKFQVNQ